MSNLVVPAGFEPVALVSSLLSDLTVPWWSAGGWALDLAAGRITRPHADVDVMLLERDEHALRDLRGVEVQLTAGPDDTVELWPESRRLGAGPHRFRLLAPDLPCRLRSCSVRPSATTVPWSRPPGLRSAS